MEIRRLTTMVAVSLWLALLLVAPVVVAEEPGPEQKAVSQAVEKGKKLLEAGKIDDALEKFHAARLASNDRAPAAFIGLARSELAYGNLELALQHTERALELTDEPASRAEISNLKGSIFFSYLGRPLPEAPDSAKQEAMKGALHSQALAAQAKLAETHFREALDLSGGKLNAARLNLAEALERQGKREESRESVGEYLKHATTDDERAAARNLQCWLREPLPELAPEVVKSGRLTDPVKRNDPIPEYTPRARRNRTQGMVITQVIIDEEGNTECIKVLWGLHDGLTGEAIKALRKWKYEPATLDGKPVRIRWNLTINFRLAG